MAKKEPKKPWNADPEGDANQEAAFKEAQAARSSEPATGDLESKRNARDYELAKEGMRIQRQEYVPSPSGMGESQKHHPLSALANRVVDFATSNPFNKKKK